MDGGVAGRGSVNSPNLSNELFPVGPRDVQDWRERGTGGVRRGKVRRKRRK